MTSYTINLETKDLGKRICRMQSRVFREKIMDLLFGKRSRVLILVPEDSVQSVTFTDADEDAAQD